MFRPTARIPVNLKIIEAARRQLARSRRKNDGDDRAKLRAIVDGSAQTVDIEWWRGLHGVSSRQVRKALVRLASDRNPNAYERALAAGKLAKLDAGLAMPPSAPGLEKHDREERAYRAALASQAKPGPSLNITRPAKTKSPKTGKPEPSLNTTKKPRSADRHLEPNRDRHRPGYLREFMRSYMRAWRARRKGG
jgi:hypothetical protein